jgi:hypothetical protein
MPLRQSTDRRPVSIARIVQRLAAVQNAFRCSVEQNFCADPPVARGVKRRPHQRQQGLSAAAEADDAIIGFGRGSKHVCIVVFYTKILT